MLFKQFLMVNYFTGLGNILQSRPDLTLQQLLAANANNANVNATYVRCGAEVKVPCKAGSPMCKGPPTAFNNPCQMISAHLQTCCS